MDTDSSLNPLKPGLTPGLARGMTQLFSLLYAYPIIKKQQKRDKKPPDSRVHVLDGKVNIASKHN